MLLLAALLAVTECVIRFVKPKRSSILAIALCLLTVGLIVTVYTLRGAGVMDYKCTVAVNLLWPAATLLLMRRNTIRGSAEDRESEEAERKGI